MPILYWNPYLHVQTLTNIDTELPNDLLKLEAHLLWKEKPARDEKDVMALEKHASVIGAGPMDEEPKDVKISTKGFLFIRDKNHPRMGEAWRDPSGLVWGEPKYAGSLKQAISYCHGIGAELASGDDFTNLSGYLRDYTKKPYDYEAVLPNFLPGGREPAMYWRKPGSIQGWINLIHASQHLIKEMVFKF